eukprot:COSAG01_NODE_77665_length_160_cov_10.409836_1_plen_23_part_01
MDMLHGIPARNHREAPTATSLAH